LSIYRWLVLAVRHLPAAAIPSCLRLPLSIGGAIAALLLTWQQLTHRSWIGILILIGHRTKNAHAVEFAVESIR